MPRFARIFFILLASAAGSCSSEQLAQKQVEKKDIRQQLATACESCVRTSFASQLPTMVDRNMAIDQAFTVCQTEEKKLQDVSDGAISAYRNTLKEELLRR
jgi:type II secretory pathway component PulF